MSRTHRHAAPRVRAARHIARDGDGAPILPRVVERKPRRGNVHALASPAVRKILGRLPLEQLYGLERIELRGRTGAVGKPFAEYRRDERAILLFSLPAEVWWLPRGFDVAPLRLARYHARVVSDRSGHRVTFASPAWLAI